MGVTTELSYEIFLYSGPSYSHGESGTELRYFVDSDEDNDSSGAANEISHEKFYVLSFL